MKKTISLLLVFAILFATAGVTVARHFCTATNKKIEIENCCKKCNTGCCKDEIKVY